MLLCLCNSLSSWIEAKPAGFPGSSSWLGERGMQWMQPLGLAAEQRVLRELMLQQWESDYKVLALQTEYGPWKERGRSKYGKDQRRCSVGP